MRRRQTSAEMSSSFCQVSSWARATEAFFEKCTDGKKGSALVFKVGAQAASMYTTLREEVKEFMEKGIFDSRDWVTLLQVCLFPSAFIYR